MPDLSFFNTMGRKLEPFVPLRPGKVGFYGCGPTVYNYAHIGNLRTYIFEDILVRTLRRFGYEVTHVMNITDVGHLTGDVDSGEDKMVKSAQERHKSVLDIADFYTEAFFRDTDRLNIIRPTIVCKATDHIGDMIELIQRIEAKGYTYFAGGNLYFDVSKFPRYSELANLRMDELKAGARIDVDANKRNPFDFVLWFTKSKFENQALSWDSPWGRGSPGWHIECSAMSMKYLGETFDIHAGGIDHVPIHHTNEIAQSESATGKKWVNYWLHAEFLIEDKGKMSKSSGNFLTLQTLVDKGYDPLDYRFFCLGAQYRSQLAFSWDALDQAASSRKSLTDRILAIKDRALAAAAGAASVGAAAVGAALSLPTDDALGPAAAARCAAFNAHLAADLALPRALAELWGLVRDADIPPAQVLAAAYDMDKVLGLGLASLARSGAERPVDADLSAEIDALVLARTEAKKAKNWARADEIRAKLREKGVALEDSPSGTVWKLLDTDHP